MRTPRMVLRDFVAEDFDAVLELNQASVPEVGSIDESRLHQLVAWAERVRVIEHEDIGVGGLLFILGSGTDYDSPNYRWFSERYARFAYVDRIAIDARLAGQGLGSKLYQESLDWAALHDWPRLCAEVNVQPPNPGSLRFHARMGFEQIAEIEPYGTPDYRVAMLVRDI